MESLKKLLNLELIGWILLALNLFAIASVDPKWAVLLILLCKLCRTFDWKCKWCKCNKTCEK